ncbi:MAG: phage terminase small subunit P27 family [Chloroflexi bacterium]|nr:phage terminase small subunit P27 family [Chloroflexota bacterium]
MRGRRPKPPGMSTRRPDRPRGGPLAQLPTCPPHLQGEARKAWRQLGRKLLGCGLMTEIDGAALALYCQAWARWVDAERALEKYGVMVKSPNGFPMQSPYLAIANKAMEQMTKLLTEFGMSPSSRARVAVTAPPPPAVEERRTEEEEEDPRIRLLRSAP